MKNPIIVWKVEPINDFFDEPFTQNGMVYQPKLAVPGSKSIRENLSLVARYAANTPGYRDMGTVDDHTANDIMHVKKWGMHSERGTAGQALIHEVQLPNTLYIPQTTEVDPKLVAEATLHTGPVYFFKHERTEDTDADACNSPRANPNIAATLAEIKPSLILLGGVVLGYCVKDARDYFRELRYRVGHVTDATKEFAADELALYGKWKEEGDLLVHTYDVLVGKLEELVR
ncbi:MAG: hypothetical protein AABX70_08480 [Nanoarchaeota archaeon]